MIPEKPRIESGAGISASVENPAEQANHDEHENTPPYLIT
jgi:hypothetical protein